MFPWPTIELTDFERRYVRIYKNKQYPGVLNRRYRVTLNSQADPDKNLPVIKTTGQIQISRRARVYALTFVGNTDRWRLNISNASGTQFTNKSPRSHLDPIVSCLVPGDIYNALSLGGQAPPFPIAPGIGIGPKVNYSNALLTGAIPFPLLIEPNWVLVPNETLIFSGTPIPIGILANQEEQNYNLILDIVVHVWEFPGMETAEVS